jgi:hypothetical protein
MISRRPNRRASTENAPGPSSTIAISIVAARMIGSFASNNVSVQGGRRESPIPIKPSPARVPATGVRKPTSSIAPAAKAPKPTHHAPEVELGSYTYNPPCTSNDTPSTARNSSRPIPGDPPGNAGNSRCSRCLLKFLVRSRNAPASRVVDTSTTGIPKSRNLFVTLSGDRADHNWMIPRRTAIAIA